MPSLILWIKSYRGSIRPVQSLDISCWLSLGLGLDPASPRLLSEQLGEQGGSFWAVWLNGKALLISFVGRSHSARNSPVTPGWQLLAVWEQCPALCRGWGPCQPQARLAWVMPHLCPQASPQPHRGHFMRSSWGWPSWVTRRLSDVNNCDSNESQMTFAKGKPGIKQTPWSQCYNLPSPFMNKIFF